jgi:hypothetical protein
MHESTRTILNSRQLGSLLALEYFILNFRSKALSLSGNKFNPTLKIMHHILQENKRKQVESNSLKKRVHKACKP